MRLANVIIKLETRQNRVEFLSANNLDMSFAGHERRAAALLSKFRPLASINS
jgi:hypothetical protein